MVTITAPGVEINELDLSKYDIDKSVENTQNVLVCGFASKGRMNSPYEFTSQNTDADLIETFGTPTNEAERYFYNTCSEIIKRDKVKLYATRFPYLSETNEYFCSTYKIVDVDAKITKNLVGELRAFARIAEADGTLSTKYLAKVCYDGKSTINITELDKRRLRETLPDDNTFEIVDKTQTVYGKIPVDSTHITNEERYMFGIIPVVTTAANAMYFQKLISNDVDALPSYESTKSIKDYRGETVLSNYLVYPASSEQLEVGNKNADTISKIAAQYFPTVNMNTDGTFERDRLKNIGVVVFKGFIDPEYNNIINYQPIESFAGSLKSDELDPTDGTSRFIDDIINTNSKYIEFYSNCFNGAKIQKIANATFSQFKTRSNKNVNSTNDLSGLNDNSQMFASNGNDGKDYEEIGLLFMNNQVIDTNGFAELKIEYKKINVDRIMQSLDETYEKCKNVNSLQLDLIVDAGMSNIALFMQTVNLNCTSDPWLEYYDIISVKKFGDSTKSAVALWLIHSSSGAGSSAYTSKWQLVLKKMDNFCKLRKDCMFIADGLRPLCISGNAKRVSFDDYRHTVTNTIVPDMKFIANKINTSYGAGYCDWYKIIDPTSGVGIWMPPSSRAVLTYLDNTNDYDYWTVPAGVNYGRMNVQDGPSQYPVIDIAFNPTVQEAGDIYTKQWNYAAKYSDVGFVIEGQKTFQTRQTAFDRVNVRRLFLFLERKVYNAAKYFVYQGNTAYTRQRLVDAIKPYFEDAKVRGGLTDYRIQCDDKNNTPATIDANELHVKIAIKPTKSIEFIECTFVALKSGASFTEVGMEE